MTSYRVVVEWQSSFDSDRPGKTWFLRTSTTGERGDGNHAEEDPTEFRARQMRTSPTRKVTTWLHRHQISSSGHRIIIRRTRISTRHIFKEDSHCLPITSNRTNQAVAWASGLVSTPCSFAPSFPRRSRRLLTSISFAGEEEAYAEKVAALFKTGRVPNCPEGLTMRALLADLLNCAPMRVSKKFSGERAIGKCSYKRVQDDLSKEEEDLKPLEEAFHRSLRGVGHLKMSLAHTSNLMTPVEAAQNPHRLEVNHNQMDQKPTMPAQMVRFLDSLALLRAISCVTASLFLLRRRWATIQPTCKIPEATRTTRDRRKAHHECPDLR